MNDKKRNGYRYGSTSRFGEATDRRTVLKIMAGAGTGAMLPGLLGFSGAAYGQGAKSLTIGLSVDPGGTVDPRIIWNIPNISAVANHIYEPLVARGEQMEIVPVLAESWEWQDSLNLVIHLRKDAKFHNGEKFDARSVKFTLDSIYNPDTKSPLRGLLPVGGKVEIVDDYTVKFVVQKPFRPLITLMPWVLMMPADAAKQGTNFAKTAIGTGPFKFERYLPSERLDMVRNQDYRGDKPPLERLSIRYIPENGTRVASLETGEVLMINNVPPDQIGRIRTTPGLEILHSDTLRMVYLAMQCERPPFNNVKARQAVAHAIDRQALIDTILQGYGSPAKAPLSPLARTYRDDLPPYDYNPDKARSLLAEAGVKPGTKVKFGAPSGRYLMDKQVAEVCHQWLGDIGLDVSLETSEFGVYWPKAAGGEFDIYMGSRTGATTANDPLVLNDFYTPTAAKRVKYSNSRVDELVEEGLAAAESTEQGLAKIYGEIQEIVWHEVPYAFMYYQPELVAVSKTLKGFKARADEMYYFHNAYVS